MPSPMSPLDAAFLLIESHEAPAHVGALQIFSLPADAPADFMQNLMGHLRSDTDLSAPWNKKLSTSPLGKLYPQWEVDRDVDLEYHVRHYALPQPGSERELGVLVSRLHSLRLNRRKPLWECHVIEGLENNRFALFTKVHHALVDGVSAMRLLVQSLSTDAGEIKAAPWSGAFDAGQRVSASRPRSSLTALRSQLAAMPESLKAFGSLAKSASRSEDALTVPMQGPRSVLNRRVTSERRFATQSMSLDRVKAVAKAAEVTVNDVVLAICGSALRAFLKNSNNLPSKSLTAMIPVSLRKKGSDSAGGNAVGSLLARLGTDVADPRRRLLMIAEDTARAKTHLNTLSDTAVGQYSNLFITPFVIKSATAYRPNSRPYFNVTISNVPGPAEPLYLMGARMEACYPASIPTHGQCLNITCTSYAGNLNFGFTGCRDALPHMQNIALYSEDALAELEVALGLVAAGAEGAAQSTAA